MFYLESYCLACIDYLFEGCYTVPKYMALDVVMINGIPFMYMISTASVTFPCLVTNSSGGSSHVLSFT